MKVTVKIHSRLKGRLIGQVRDAWGAALTRVVPIAIDAIGKVADTKLHSKAKEFKAELPDAVTITPRSGLKIELTGFAKELEEGFPAFDMKPGLLASSSAKQGPNGPYVDVPFRHALEANATRFQGMPNEIKQRVRSAIAHERLRAKVEGREERNPMRVTGKMPASQPKHTTSIYSDMLRTARQAGSRTTSTYQTIRRISKNSDPASWQHPGFSGIHALPQVKRYLETQLRQLFNEELRRRGMKTR